MRAVRRAERVIHVEVVAGSQVLREVGYVLRRTVTDERPIKPSASPAAITDEDVLTFMLSAIDPWLQR